MENLNLKKAGLQLLVTNNILTQEEADASLRAIRNLYESDDADTSSNSNSDGCVFDDNNLRVTYKSMADVNNLFFGKGIEFKFILENKTPFKIRVSAKDISINGFVISNDELISSELTPNKKSLDSFHLFKGLSEIDVESVGDITELEFAISYEIEDLNYETTGESMTLEF